jgi:hypothetical protein
MKLFLLINLVLCVFVCDSNAQNSLLPLHIHDIITKIATHRYFQFNDVYLKQLQAVFIRQEEYRSSFNPNSSNISIECLSQIDNLINAIQTGEYWALRSLLAYLVVF